METYGKIKIGEDKRSKRKLKKIKSELDRAKKRFLILFITHMAIFIVAYTLLITLVFLLTPQEYFIVDIPVSIPLISYRVGEYYRTSIVFIAFIGFMLPHYLFSRIVKSVQSSVRTE